MKYDAAQMAEMKKGFLEIWSSIAFSLSKYSPSSFEPDYRSAIKKLLTQDFAISEDPISELMKLDWSCKQRVLTSGDIILGFRSTKHQKLRISQEEIGFDIDLLPNVFNLAAHDKFPLRIIFGVGGVWGVKYWHLHSDPAQENTTSVVSCYLSEKWRKYYFQLEHKYMLTDDDMLVMWHYTNLEKPSPLMEKYDTLPPMSSINPGLQNWRTVKAACNELLKQELIQATCAPSRFLDWCCDIHEQQDFT